MIKVWILIAYMQTGYSGGPLVVDNIATQQECVRLAANVRYIAEDTNNYLSRNIPTRCVEVWKVK